VDINPRDAFGSRAKPVSFLMLTLDSYSISHDPADAID
jgi:hypothetical protein